MYFKKIPSFVQKWYPDFLWQMPSIEKVLYLTFDDGPTPQITDWVLDQLAEYEARATFFLLGANVKCSPEAVHRLLDEGHAVGNHLYHHVDGWKTDTRAYLRQFLMGQHAIREYSGHRARLFRPPYGHINRGAVRYIQRSHRIVMMDVICGDFDTRVDGAYCYRQAVQHARPGSIVLLHDSQKAWPRLSFALPRILAHFSAEGYRFEALSGPAKRALPLLEAQSATH
jgi:peptidoglycan/xylan/chitin deacetylase (PgdA/CDA1 family)